MFPFYSKVVVASIVAVSFLTNLHRVWTTEFRKINRNGRLRYVCMIGLRSSQTATINLWMQTFICFVIPMLVIMVANVCIVVKLKRRKKSLMIRTQREVTLEAQRRKDRKVTVMLLVLTLVFLVLLLPLFACHLYKYFLPSKKKRSKLIYLVFMISQRLWYTNNAVNFYIYALFGSEFRKELRALFRRRNRVAPSTTHPSVKSRGTSQAS